MPRRFPAMPEWGRMLPYRPRTRVREERCASRAAVLLAVLATCAGCAAQSDAYDDPSLETGSISAYPASLRMTEGTAPKGVIASDWRVATLALDQAMATPEADDSITWENPLTGTRGTATPIGDLRTGQCRDFMIAVLVENVADRWVRGEACRAEGGRLKLTRVRLLGQA